VPTAVECNRRAAQNCQDGKEAGSMTAALVGGFDFANRWDLQARSQADK
jgi:hypothetical protein